MNAMKTMGGEARLPDDAAAKAAARKQNLHTIIQVVGMLPVLILICIGFEFADRQVPERPQHLDRDAAGLDQHRAGDRPDLRHPDRRHRSGGRLGPGGLRRHRRVHVSRGRRRPSPIPAGLLVGLVLGASTAA